MASIAGTLRSGSICFNMLWLADMSRSMFENNWPSSCIEMKLLMRSGTTNLRICAETITRWLVSGGAQERASALASAYDDGHVVDVGLLGADDLVDDGGAHAVLVGVGVLERRRALLGDDGGRVIERRR